MSKRGELWQKFSQKVLTHINEYTVPQYGDWPDQMSTYDIDTLINHIQRYVSRVKTNARGLETSILDSIKIAHYASELHDRLIKITEDDAYANQNQITCPKCGHKFRRGNDRN